MNKMVLLSMLVVALLLMTSLVSARGYLPGVDDPRPGRTFTTLTGVWIPGFSFGWVFLMNYGPGAVFEPGGRWTA